MATCYRHPKEETGVSCSSCGRPICTECMTPTNVGMRCPECSKQKTQVRTARSIYSGVPELTYAIIAVNVIAFFAQVLTAGSGIDAGSGWVFRNGALSGFSVEIDGEWYRMLTAGFLHADPLHLILNMVGVFFLGQMLEPRLGKLRFGALYFATLLAGSFGALVLSPNAWTIGASGAVFGLLGGAFMLLRQQGINPMQTFVGPFLILNLLFTFAGSNISIGGHLGGLAGGVLCAYFIGFAGQRRFPAGAVIGCVAVGVLAVVGGIWAAGNPSFY